MFCEDTLLATAQKSPLAVAAHDKTSWLALFSHDAEVHDPVGSRGHAGAQALERFYDTFIAPNKIQFHVEHDIISEQWVVRDLVISTHMSGTTLQVDVPLFIRYQIVDEAGEPRIRRLYAHWELLPMMSSQVFNQGLGAGIAALVKLSGNMLRHQGLSGALGFSRAFLGAGNKAKTQSKHCLHAIAQADTQKLLAMESNGVKFLAGNQPLSAHDLIALLPGLRWEKVLAGGQQVTARLLHQKGRGVALFDFSNKNELKQLCIYNSID